MSAQEDTGGAEEALCHQPGHIARWGMVIDVNRCVGCQTCTIACKHANDTPPGVQWRQVLDVERGSFPDVERLFMVVGCQHCAEPPCVPVCPTGASYKRPDNGVVLVDYDKCIGCKYCSWVCPYGALQFDPQKGVMGKCDLCADYIDQGKNPSCVDACPMRALDVGDYDALIEQQQKRLEKEEEQQKESIEFICMDINS